MPAPEQDVVRQFRHHIGRDLDARLNTTQAVVALIHAATTNHGWTPKQLADECGRDLADVRNAGAVITERLRKAAQHPPVARAAKVPGALLPWCSPDCKARAGWIEDDTGRPIGRCPCRTAPQEAHV